jgi:hypothetical protein
MAHLIRYSALVSFDEGFPRFWACILKMGLRIHLIRSCSA